MFQNLSQGASVFVFDKNLRKVNEGRVVFVNTHMPVYNQSRPMALMNGPVTDISVQIGNDTTSFQELPANAVVANIQDKGLFLALDKSSVIKEVEALASASRQALQSVPLHEKIVADCDALLVELQPEKKKAAQQAQDIEELKSRLDKIMEMLSAKS